jgi:tRNA-(ms[2]io[6]A)-hydroxylase
MLGLKLPTDPRWASLVERNLEEVLTDHAWCEQKAVSNAITILVNNSEREEVVRAMTSLAKEELSHFELVQDKIRERGFKLGPERKDCYVNDLMAFVRKGGNKDVALVDRLLFGAMIEARSCERFKILSEKLKDTDLAAFYYDLMVSEAGHYTMFIKLAKTVAPDHIVDQRWQEFLEYESRIIAGYSQNERIHG